MYAHVFMFVSVDVTFAKCETVKISATCAFLHVSCKEHGRVNVDIIKNISQTVAFTTGVEVATQTSSEYVRILRMFYFCK